jgi:hypothetical protein
MHLRHPSDDVDAFKARCVTPLSAVTLRRRATTQCTASLRREAATPMPPPIGRATSERVSQVARALLGRPAKRKQVLQDVAPEAAVSSHIVVIHAGDVQGQQGDRLLTVPLKHPGILVLGRQGCDAPRSTA